ncbi:hypothetical protein niasHT_008782 [Heterodera trifolii]|uniref:B30.2/SPRY domain-containing protein n=1 Tax=Heterodera trifolii TaxID=157864 RepID=A0ABD2M5S2_9BILA
MPLDKGVGEWSATYSYDNATHFFCDGTKIGWKSRFYRDDVIGCGVNLVTGRIIFTKNGQRQDTANLFASPPIDQLFPCVSLLDSGDLIEANFGPTFEFNPANCLTPTELFNSLIIRLSSSSPISSSNDDQLGSTSSSVLPQNPPVVELPLANAQMLQQWVGQVAQQIPQVIIFICFPKGFHTQEIHSRNTFWPRMG